MTEFPQPDPQRDPLHDIYHESFIDNPAHFRNLASHNTALLSIDLQYLDAAEGYGIFRDAHTAGVPLDAQRYYFRTLRQRAIPNVQRLQRAFRKHGLELAHTRIQSLTADGRDRSTGHKRLNILAPPGSKEAQFLPEVAPEADEIVIDKTASGVFSSTNMNYVLSNMGMKELFICGVYTNECVETTVRDACDLGYLVTLVEDACTTVTRELHEASLATLRDRYARVITTGEAIAELGEYAARRAGDKSREVPESA